MIFEASRPGLCGIQRDLPSSRWDPTISLLTELIGRLEVLLADGGMRNHVASLSCVHGKRALPRRQFIAATPSGSIGLLRIWVFSPFTLY